MQPELALGRMSVFGASRFLHKLCDLFAETVWPLLRPGWPALGHVLCEFSYQADFNNEEHSFGTKVQAYCAAERKLFEKGSSSDKRCGSAIEKNETELLKRLFLSFTFDC